MDTLGIGALPLAQLRDVIAATYVEDNVALFEILGIVIVAYDHRQPKRA